MVRLSAFVTSALALGASAGAVVDLIPSNFDSIVHESGKPALVEFFAPWCGHCKNLAPVYEELATQFESQKDKVTIAKVDADEHRSLGTKYGINGFPTIKWFDGKSKEPVDYKSGRDLDSLANFVTEQTGVKPRISKVPSQVEMLNDTSFEEKVGGDADVIVAFTAPWCGHCKQLAPVWEKLALTYQNEPSVLVGKVDCESANSKATAKAAGITGYPTIKYYPAGSKTAIPYDSGRNEQNLVSFINKQAGTHRMPGGELDALAGTIPALSDLVAGLKEGGAEAQKQFEGAVAGAKGKYAEYYAKVAKKAADNEEYVEKELARLQGIVKKGGLAPEKVDDLKSRSNILNVFVKEQLEKAEAPKEEL
ncbi:hypothetical protein MBLNU230_g4530t1 [Neophaeotheca triangularis]